MKRITFAIFLAVIIISFFYRLPGLYAYMSDKAVASGVFVAEIPGPSPTILPTAIPSLTPTPGSSIDHIIINEISTRGNEWIELYNPTGATITLINWSIRDNSTNAPDTFQGTISLSPRTYAIVVANGQTPPTTPTDTLIIEVDDSALGNGLNDSGDKIELLNDASETVDAVSYGNIGIPGFVPPLPNPGLGQSFARNSIFDTDTSTDWAVSSTPGPGEENIL